MKRQWQERGVDVLTLRFRVREVCEPRFIYMYPDDVLDEHFLWEKSNTSNSSLLLDLTFHDDTCLHGRKCKD